MESLTANETRGVKRYLWIAIFWLIYLVYPFSTGMLFLDRIGFLPGANDIFYHACAIHGYGMIGCFFHAFTAKKPNHSDKTLKMHREEQFWIAYGVNLTGPLMVVLYSI